MDKYMVFDFELRTSSSNEEIRQQLTKEETTEITNKANNKLVENKINNFLAVMDGENLRLYLKCYTTPEYDWRKFFEIPLLLNVHHLKCVGYEEITMDDFDFSIISEREYYED